MRDELVWIATLVGLPSCVLGGGPFVAYGERGWTGGLEGGAGVSIVEASVGADIHVGGADPYVRADLVPLADVAPTDQTMPVSARQSIDLRIGAGWSADHGPMFLLGGGGQEFLRRAPTCNAEIFRVDALSLVGSVELQVRFNGGWSLALAPRVDLRAVHCEST